MPWDEIWRIAVAIGLPAAALVPVGRGLWRLLKGKLERPDGEDRVLRPHRRPHRYPLLQPIFERDRERGRLLVDLVRQTSVPPLRGFVHPLRLRTADRWATRNLFTFDTDPKPAFAIKSWRFDLERDLDASEFFGHSTGFLLRVELEQGESRSHLLKSFKNGKSVEKRVVAIAPVEALADPTVWVRCLVVNAYAADAPDSQKSMIGVQSARESETVFRARQKDIPDDALWLICRGQGQTQPGPDWGHSSDHFDADPDDFPQMPKKHREHLERARRRDRQRQWRLWLMAVPGFVVGLVVMGILLGTLGVFLQWWFSLFGSPIQWPWWLTEVILRVWFYFAVVPWSVGVSLAALLWLSKSLDARSTKRRWLRRDGRKETTYWPGGTAECLRLGHLYFAGPNLDADQWQHYWHPQQPLPDLPSEA